MQLFLTRTISEAFLTRLKRPKIHRKEKRKEKEGRERKKRLAYLLFLYRLLGRKKPKRVKMVKIGQICAGIFLKIQSDIGQHKFLITCRLPLLQYCVKIQIFGESTQAPIKRLMFGCWRSYTYINERTTEKQLDNCVKEPWITNPRKDSTHSGIWVKMYNF